MQRYGTDIPSNDSFSVFSYPRKGKPVQADRIFSSPQFLEQKLLGVTDRMRVFLVQRIFPDLYAARNTEHRRRERRWDGDADKLDLPGSSLHISRNNVY